MEEAKAQVVRAFAQVFGWEAEVRGRAAQV